MRATFFLLVATSLSRLVSAADWPEWRGGPNRDGLWSEPGLSTTFPNDGPKILWKANLGTGYSGPAVANGLVYVLDRLKPPAASNDTERVVCLDLKTGKERWIHSYPCTFKFEGGYDNGPRSTPTARDGRVYTLGGMGHLHCLDAKSGRVLWKKDLAAEYRARIPDWGVVNAPLIEGSLVIVQAGGVSNACVVAFDKSTGQEVWRSLEDKPGYAAIIGINSGGQRQLIVWTAEAMCSLNPKTGAVFWRLPRKLAWDQAVATPLFCAEKNILLFSSDREGTIALQLDNQKPGCTVAWDNVSYSALHGSAVLVDHYLYGLNHNGNIKPECGELRCVDVVTGQKLWTMNTVTKMAFQTHATVTRNTANGLFYITNEQGELIIAEANPKGYRELARAQLSGKTWSHPAYANGCIVTRAENWLICAELK